MRRLHLAPVAATAALSVAAPSAAGQASYPEVLTFSDRGSLQVASSVLVARRVADMRGGWFNEGVACRASRRLRVTIEILRTFRGNTAGRVRRSKSGAVRNCAEGGPNFGYAVRAAAVGLACPNGAWRPGRYDFVTRTRHRRTGMRATAAVSFRVRTAC